MWFLNDILKRLTTAVVLLAQIKDLVEKSVLLQLKMNEHLKVVEEILNQPHAEIIPGIPKDKELPNG